MREALLDLEASIDKWSHNHQQDRGIKQRIQVLIRDETSTGKIEERFTLRLRIDHTAASQRF